MATMLLNSINFVQNNLAWATLSKNLTNITGTSPLVSVTIDIFDNIFVADSSNHKIQKFDSKGKFLTMWGSTGKGNGQFTGQLTLSHDKYGSIFVVDSGNHNIQQFSNDGKFVRSFRY